MNTSLYKELPFLYREGTSVINLNDLNIGVKTKAEFKTVILSNQTHCFGSSSSSEDVTNFLVELQHNIIQILVGNKACFRNITYNLGDIAHIIFRGDAYLEFNGKVICEAIDNPTEFTRKNLVICGSYRTGDRKSANQYVYFVKIWEDGETLTYDMIPVKRLSDGVVGMYNKVNDTFYPPTVGTFKAPLTLQISEGNATALQIPEGNVIKIEDKEGNILWTSINNQTATL